MLVHPHKVAIKKAEKFDDDLLLEALKHHGYKEGDDWREYPERLTKGLAKIAHKRGLIE